MKIIDLISSAFRSTTGSSEVRRRPDYQFVGFAKEHSLASPPSRRSDPLETREVDLTGGYKVKIQKGIRQITLFRFLTAKCLYDEDGLHLDEFLVLFELYYNLLESRDPSFEQKYGKWFEETLPFFIDLSKGISFPLKLNKENKESYKKLIEFLQPVVPSASAYFGLKGQKGLRRGWRLLLNRHLPPAKIPPKSFIGVGYRDKGSRKDVAYDGSPSWQEVASHSAEMERRLEEEIEISDFQPSPLLE